MLLKKGAMFGLDARIALAIFGALSVISGAALYSAIQNAKITGYISDMQELGKAIEQYMLDTGQDIPRHSTGLYMADLEELVTSSKNGWKGPYYSKEYADAQAGFVTNVPFYTTGTTKLRVDILDGDAVLGLTESSAGKECTSSSKYCYYWIRYGAADGNGTAQAIDEFVDGTLDPNAGKIRYYHNVANDYYHIWIKGPKTLTQTN